MSALWLPIIAIVVGLFFCFRGYVAMRLGIAVWGAFVGFTVGAAVVSSITGTPMLTGVVGWVGALLGALLLGSLSFAFYAVAVLVTMGSVGYAVGTGLAGYVGGPSWVLTVGGVVGAIVLVLIAVATHLPDLLLILVSAAGGASAVVSGVGLLLGSVAAGEGPLGQFLGAVNREWWLGLAYLVLVVAGVLVQLRSRTNVTLRSAYR